MRGARARLALLGALVLWPAAAAAQAQPSPALASYVQGLDAIRQGRYDEATAALGRAVQAAPDPSFILARGVAQCLGEKPRDAVTPAVRHAMRQAGAWFANRAATRASSTRPRSSSPRSPGCRASAAAGPATPTSAATRRALPPSRSLN